MKRVIKYYSKYQSDSFKFSDCSTEYEILPIVVADSANENELLEIIRRLELTTGKIHIAETPNYGFRELTITHAIEIGTKVITRNSFRNETETLTEYIGFITIPKGSLETLESIDNDMTQEQMAKIINNQDYGIDNVGDTVDGATIIVKSGWNYYHAMAVNGYSIEKFETLAGITEHGFYDDTSMCYGCNKFDSNDNGYTHNFRDFESDWLGVNCGCYDSACESNYHSFINESDKAMELKTAETLESNGTIEHVQRYIGGMVDGRGGYYNGESVPEGNPKDILAELLKNDSEGEYIFTHDESGQFQTYFSVWKVIAD